MRMRMTGETFLSPAKRVKRLAPHFNNLFQNFMSNKRAVLKQPSLIGSN